MQTLRRLYALLVDDDLEACLRMQQALDDSSIVLSIVTTVAEARSCLAESIPDILICEVRIGKESGLGLCRFIRATPSLQPSHHVIDFICYASR